MIKIEKSRLLALSPAAFENMVFDLVRSGLLENLAWRTPGADGGRDIEGTSSERDISGQVQRFKWLVECKRYKKSVGWPTVWEKLSFADSGGADYLLMVMTTTPTPRCLDEIEKWNKARRLPQIRCWPLHELMFRLELNEKIARKYGIVAGAHVSAAPFVELALHVARMCQSVISGLAVGAQQEKHEQAAAYLSELLYARSNDIRQGTFLQGAFLKNEAWPEFVVSTTAPYSLDFDRTGMLAFLSCLHLVTGSKLLLIEIDRDCVLCLAEEAPLTDFVLQTSLVSNVSFWSGIVPESDGESLCLTRQILI